MTMVHANSVAASTARWAPPTVAAPLDLDPFDRMLLIADGTVTTLLEACTGESIITRTTRQAGPATLNQIRAAAGCWWHPDTQLVELTATERLIARRVTLNRAHSGVTYVLAESLTAPTGCRATSPPGSNVPGPPRTSAHRRPTRDPSPHP
jgi:hypothetical protein